MISRSASWTNDEEDPLPGREGLTCCCFAYAAIGATLLAMMGLRLGYLIQTRAFGIWRGVDLLTLFLFTLPGTVIGIGLVILWNRPATNLIYGTAAIVILGYIAKYTALTSRIASVAFALIPPSMEEAAQVAGATWIRRFSWISVPLAGRGIIGSWLMAYIFCQSLAVSEDAGDGCQGGEDL